MIEILYPVAIGVFSSIAASILFTSILYSLKPKITISPYIAKNIDVYDDSVYDIKVINKGRRSVIDVRAEILLMTKENVRNGQIDTTKKIPMAYESIFLIKSRNSRRFPIKVNLEESWQNDAISYLLFRIIVRDSFTGFGKVFEKRFHTKGEILNGKHEFGSNGINVV